ncbi:arylesterase [Eleftheria terrae]|uniref:arylesterase n=1 Tax=Eleftheria terrae TaxID=1597781 RepID=UPI00263AD9FE|nr:arylesterase [Eleftheria terrae]WKB53530.1 arylesterase [Eleftheria terrae]
MVPVFQQRRHFILLGLASAVLAQSPAGARAAAPVKVLVVGDSLSAEYGLTRGKGWVALLERQLAAARPQASVINASISGDTTSGGRSRLPALLKQHRPTHVVLELGGNDALRGLPMSMTEANLGEMTRDAQEAGAKVLLLGMQMPPNYGRAYAESFAAVYAKVAQARQAALVPFFLKGVGDAANSTELFQADRIHPNERAQALMLDNVWPALQRLLEP